MLNRRTFLYSGLSSAVTPRIFTLSAGLSNATFLFPKKSHAWIGAAIAVAQVAYSIYQSSKTPRAQPDLKLQLIQESIGLLKDAHLRLGGIEIALEEILAALSKLPDQTRVIVKEELDEFETAKLLAACDNVISTVGQLEAQYPNEPLSRIPSSRIADLKTHLNLLKDRRATLFLRSDLSALALCAAASVELAAEEFLEFSKSAARVTLFAYLDKFSAMEKLSNPESLHALYQASNQTVTVFEDSSKRFNTDAPLGYFFSHPDLRMAGLAPGETVPTGQTKIRRYLHSYVVEDELFARPGKPKYIMQVDHIVADLELEVVDNPGRRNETYTQITKFNLSVVSDKNKVVGDQFKFRKWFEADSVVTKPDLLGSQRHYVKIAGLDEAPFLSPEPRFYSVMTTPSHPGGMDDLQQAFSAAVNEYNRRVDLARTLGAMVAAVDATSADIRQQYKNWSVR